MSTSHTPQKSYLNVHCSFIHTRDLCHGLNQSATKIGRHNKAIRPTYSVVCRTWGIMSRSGCIRQHNDMLASHTLDVLYAQLIFVCRTVELSHSPPPSGPLTLASSSTPNIKVSDDSEGMDATELVSYSHGNGRSLLTCQQN